MPEQCTVRVNAFQIAHFAQLRHGPDRVRDYPSPARIDFAAIYALEGRQRVISCVAHGQTPNDPLPDARVVGLIEVRNQQWDGGRRSTAAVDEVVDRTYLDAKSSKRGKEFRLIRGALSRKRLDRAVFGELAR